MNTYTETTEYANLVLTKLEILRTSGKFYRRKIYKIHTILELYCEQVKLHYVSLGEQYILDMITNINTIFENVCIHSNYDTIEYVNLVIMYVFKLISYKYTTTQKLPVIPDYTISEINELSKTIRYLYV